jgi:phosphoribosylamine--glycine ligase
MKVLVIGSGGREHAICFAFARSPQVTKLYCADGNAGITEIAECVAIKPDNIRALADFAETNTINLTFVGGEFPLALGITDEFEKRGLKIIGVSAAAARLEASKSFAKDFMQRHGVPTATYRSARSKREAIDILISGAFGDENSPVVVKADGLAGGKGVVVATNRKDALAAVEELEEIAGVEAAGTIVLEECLFGREVSLLLFSDGTNFALMPPTRDHKRISEGDTGPNTGGMGTITDAALLSKLQTLDVVERIIKPTLNGCREEGFPLRGILFLGLMMTESGPKLLEYNVRFGDPETQSILVRLETDIVTICDAILTGSLNETEIEWKEGNSACIILAVEGYPYHPRKGDVIHGLEKAKAYENVQIFHSGTAFEVPSTYITASGRVLGVTATGESIENALSQAYDAVDEISWNGMQFRRDIGK